MAIPSQTGAASKRSSWSWWPSLVSSSQAMPPFLPAKEALVSSSGVAFEHGDSGGEQGVFGGGDGVTGEGCGRVPALLPPAHRGDGGLVFFVAHAAVAAGKDGVEFQRIGIATASREIATGRVAADFVEQLAVEGDGVTRRTRTEFTHGTAIAEILIDRPVGAMLRRVVQESQATRAGAGS